MKKYTVILKRPIYLSEEIGNEPESDMYFALLESESTSLNDLIAEARREVYEADRVDSLNPEQLTDYTLVALLEGHVKVLLYGWQA